MWGVATKKGNLRPHFLMDGKGKGTSGKKKKETHTGPDHSPSTGKLRKKKRAITYKKKRGLAKEKVVQKGTRGGRGWKCYFVAKGMTREVSPLGGKKKTKETGANVKGTKGNFEGVCPEDFNKTTKVALGNIPNQKRDRTSRWTEKKKEVQGEGKPGQREVRQLWGGKKRGQG